MPSKSSLAVCVTALAAVIVAFLKETYWGFLVDKTFEFAADFFGVERARMMAEASPFAVAIAAASVIVFVAYRLGAKDRALKPELEFVFDQNDRKFVSVEPHKTAYRVGLRVRGDRTIEFPTALIKEGPFADRMFNRRQDAPRGYHLLYSGGALDPTVMETIDLFELPQYEHLPKDPYSRIMREPNTFTLEARGRNTKPATAHFEYNPRQTPMIQRIK
jgi:hypothetical protein